MIVAVVVTNLLYLAGAIVLAVIITTILAIRHRRPRSVEANVASFHKGLRALAPDDDPSRVSADRPTWITRRPTITTLPGGASDGAAQEGGAPAAGGDDDVEDLTTDDGGISTEEAETG